MYLFYKLRHCAVSSTREHFCADWRVHDSQAANILWILILPGGYFKRRTLCFRGSANSAHWGNVQSRKSYVVLVSRREKIMQWRAYAKNVVTQTKRKMDCCCFWRADSDLSMLHIKKEKQDRCTGPIESSGWDLKKWSIFVDVQNVKFEQQTVFRRVPKTAKSDYIFVMSVRMQQLDSHQTDFDETWYLSFFSKISR